MKIRYCLLLVSFILSTGMCVAQTIGKESAIEFSTSIRPDITDWKVGEVYTDTLIYQLYNDTYDLPFVFLTTNVGDTAVLYYDGFDDLVISEVTEGTLFKIKWKIDTFYAPGEQGETYFDETLLSYVILE